jgi:hypothetical protein
VQAKVCYRHNSRGAVGHIQLQQACAIWKVHLAGLPVPLWSLTPPPLTLLPSRDSTRTRTSSSGCQFTAATTQQQHYSSHTHSYSQPLLPINLHVCDAANTSTEALSYLGDHTATLPHGHNTHHQHRQVVANFQSWSLTEDV